MQGNVHPNGDGTERVGALSNQETKEQQKLKLLNWIKVHYVRRHPKIKVERIIPAQNPLQGSKFKAEHWVERVLYLIWNIFGKEKRFKLIMNFNEWIIICIIILLLITNLKPFYFRNFNLTQIPFGLCVFSALYIFLLFSWTWYVISLESSWHKTH